MTTDDEKGDAVEAARPSSSPTARARRIGGASRPATGRRPSPGPSAERQPAAERPAAAKAAAGPDAAAATTEPAAATTEPAAADPGAAGTPVAHRPSPVASPSTVGHPETTPLQRLAILVAGVVVIALAAADVLLWHPWHHKQTVAEQRERLTASVNTALAKVVSYDYRHIDQDTATAAGYLAEPFRDEYQRSVTTTIRARALQLKSVVKGEVGSFGITSVTDDGKQATVLVLGQQTITNTLHPQGEQDPISLRVTVSLVHGRWLISKLDLV